MHHVYAKDKGKLAAFRAGDSYDVTEEKDRLELIQQVKDELGTTAVLLIDCEKLRSIKEAILDEVEEDVDVHILAEEAGLYCDGTPDSFDKEAVERFAKLVLDQFMHELKNNFNIDIAKQIEANNG